MNTLYRSAILISVLLLVAPAAFSARRDRGAAGRGPNATQCDGVMADYLASLPVVELDDTERAGVIFMREEEKLARDVYLTLYLQWGTPVFTRIARAEQKHMDAVGFLLDRYNLDDPITNDEIGSFTDPTLERLFEDLVEQGRQSAEQALLVGAAIEDLDLFDLYELIDVTDQPDLKTVFLNLAKGSRNHLRAFAWLLEMRDVEYEAQYLTQTEIDEILASERETRRIYDAEGEARRCNRR